MTKLLHFPHSATGYDFWNTFLEDRSLSSFHSHEWAMTKNNLHNDTITAQFTKIGALDTFWRKEISIFTCKFAFLNHNTLADQNGNLMISAACSVSDQKYKRHRMEGEQYPRLDKSQFEEDQNILALRISCRRCQEFRYGLYIWQIYIGRSWENFYLRNPVCLRLFLIGRIGQKD